MKIPSLFRLPSHQRFNYTPRYYDEVKEDIQERTERIRKELEQEGVLEKSEEAPDKDGVYHSRIAGSFSRRSHYKKQSNRSSLLQFVIFTILLGSFVGYLYFGNAVIYGLLLLIPLYMLLKLKKIL